MADKHHDCCTHRTQFGKGERLGTALASRVLGVSRRPGEVASAVVRWLGRLTRETPMQRKKAPSRAGQGPVRAFFRSGLGGARPSLIMAKPKCFASPPQENFFAGTRRPKHCGQHAAASVSPVARFDCPKRNDGMASARGATVWHTQGPDSLAPTACRLGIAWKAHGFAVAVIMGAAKDIRAAAHECAP